MIGEHRREALAEYGITTVGELLEFYPRKYLDRSQVMRIKDLRLTEHEITVVGKISYVNWIKSKRGKEWLVVGVNDGSGLLECIWFQGIQYWSRQLKEDQTVAVSGMINDLAERKFIHPAVDQLGDDGDTEFYNTGRIVPLYPGGMALRKAGLESRTLRKIMRLALDFAERDLIEFLPEQDLHDANALTRAPAMRQIHEPESNEQLHAAWRRVRFEELFIYQLLFAYRRRMNAELPGGIAFDKIGPCTKAVLAALPFRLTEGQRGVLTEIRHDLERNYPMQRLLQGEVGSGKTTVALLAMAMAADCGYQSAMMAPTELLAEQHAQRLLLPAAAAGLTVRLLRGKQRLAERREILEAIAGGHAELVVGTHALIQDQVQFARLGLVIIDEQHRFGVEQRTSLRSKGIRPHLLLMTATPIPRSLRMAQMGDLDVSTLRELPGGPRQVVSAIRTEPDRAKVYSFIAEQAQAGQRIFIVCPLIEESEKLDTEAAIAYHERVTRGPLKGVKVGLVHGRMAAEAKQIALNAFRSGTTPVLVCTPVIEVGVDVPEASLMLIENAERFGLAALHQLRGRIGRMGQRAFFILMPGPRMTVEAEDRIKTLCETDDGFQIAERDLELRGAGEFFGTRQSGEFELRYSNPARDADLLSLAAERAAALIERDPDLEGYPELNRRFQSKHAHRLNFPASG
ncbi:ATP-dependent DNA helicase RecG [candidate division KSB1 bacterium]|nr:ATP-dependent DNA helicase RecG [candidate division KSB1 bacterium]